MSQIRPIRNFLDNWLGPPRTLKPAAPTLLPKPSQGTMKKAEAPSPKTYGTGLESMAIYGAIPLSRERIAQVVQEAKMEALEHEVEVTAPILPFQSKRTEFGSQSGGLGITDPSIVRGVQRWEAEQRALLSTLKAPPITSTSPIKTFQN